MTIISGNIFVTGNGDTWQWPIVVTNNSLVSATSVVVNNVFTAGFTTDTFTPSQGSYNTGTDEWTVGTLAPGASATLLVECTATDIMDAPFSVTSTVSSFGTETTPLDNEASNDVAYLCSAFSDCFVDDSMTSIALTTEVDASDVLTTIEATILTPACGDTAVVGGGCSNTWISTYSCVGSAWSTPILVSKVTTFANTLFVDISTDSNDLTAVKGSTTCTFETIQAALDAASDGDTIVVMPGIHDIAAPIDLSALTGALTIDVRPGAFIRAADSNAVIDDGGTYIGKLIITGGGTIQGKNGSGLILISNTYPTSSLHISNVNIVNEDGNGVATEVDSYFSSVNIYDAIGNGKSIVTAGSAYIQTLNVFSNVVEDVFTNVSVQAITVDAHLILNYV